MELLDLQEAQLLRLLQDIFGFDRVLPYMSLLTICGGSLPILDAVANDIPMGKVRTELKLDSLGNEKQKCLFTIVDPDNEPKMVVEFAAQDQQTIDVKRLNEQQYSRLYLESIKIHYVLIDKEEFQNILNPAVELCLANLIQEKINTCT